MTSSPDRDPDTPGRDAPHGQPGYGTPMGQPEYGTSQGPAGWGAPSPQGYGPGYGDAPPASGAPAGAGRPGTVTGAALLAIVWGGIGALFGLLVTVAAFGLGAVFAGLILLASTAFSAALLWGGIQAIRGQSPRLLLIISYISIAVGLVSLVVALVTTDGNALNALLSVAIPAVVVVLIRQQASKDYYAARGIRY